MADFEPSPESGKRGVQLRLSRTGPGIRREGVRGGLQPADPGEGFAPEGPTDFELPGKETHRGVHGPDEIREMPAQTCLGTLEGSPGHHIEQGTEKRQTGSSQQDLVARLEEQLDFAAARHWIRMVKH